MQEIEVRAAAVRESFRKLYLVLDAMQLLRGGPREQKPITVRTPRALPAFLFGMVN